MVQNTHFYIKKCHILHFFSVLCVSTMWDSVDEIMNHLTTLRKKTRYSIKSCSVFA